MQQKIEVIDHKLKQVVDGSTSETSHTKHGSCSSTSLSSDVNSSDMDYIKEVSKIQESNASLDANRIDKVCMYYSIIAMILSLNHRYIFMTINLNQGKMVIQESLQVPDSESSSEEDYDSEVDERFRSRGPQQ